MKLTTSWQTVESYVWNHSSGAKVTFYLEAKYSSQNIETNKSYIDTRLRSVLNVGSISGSGYNFTCSYCLTVSGSGVWNFDTETITSKSNQEIEHNADGTKSLTLTATMSNSYHGLNQTISGTVELPTIPRASSVSSSSPYIGDNATIIISSASSSFTHTLTYSFGSASGTIATKTSATTVAWDTNAIKSTLYAQIPNAKSGTGTITCQTYNGDTLVGTKTCSFNLYAKESDCKPSISGSVVDTNSSTIALTGNSAVMVRYMSKPKVTISATANYSSSIKSYSINVDGQTSNSSSATYSTISSNSITISVTDSRGYSNSTTLKPSMINYVKLTSNLTIARPEQTSNEAYLNGSGQWFNGTFSSSNANTLFINCQYRKSGDSSWIDLGTLTPTISGNTFGFSNLKLGDSFDWKEEYQFKITITDKLQTIGSESKDIIILSVGIPIVRIGKEKVFINGRQPFVCVGATKPTTGEEVWFKPSKNLFDITKYISSLTQGYPLKGVLQVGKTYTISCNNPSNETYEILTKIDAWGTMNNDMLNYSGSGPISFEYTQAMSDKGYMLYVLLSTDHYPLSYEKMQSLDFQIEEGPIATDYEPHGDKKIYIKTDNGVYEEFYSKEEPQWIDIPYENGYSSLDENAWNKLQYKQIGKQVFLRGMIKNSNANPSGYYATCGTLPQGARPMKGLYLAGSQGDATVRHIDVVVNNNGQIQVYNTLANVWLSLDGLSFFID